ncbi:hypothetical protein BU23DRAFT_651311 [Bimuria novae-zelandiae CBS 107.79]|uniref:DUF7730 domain-containing protein n=1 Tax=Bimuria novae-zelandiae CBS 107.79 TaxID=1447943 RepID=A0A6A5VPK4_9PLEO|nr:hypothetical protein BU23DRAFT_651311 [Bimuria novae-zelandiae CBS 107.79]
MAATTTKRAQDSIRYGDVIFVFGGEGELAVSDRDNSGDHEPPSKRLKKHAVKDPVNKKSDTHFPFLKLPAEMRNSIYEFALVTTDKIRIHRVMDPVTKCRTYAVRENSKYVPRTKDNEIAIGLLRACKQTHKEASEFLYTKNRFVFPGTGELSSFFGRYYQHVQHLTRVKVDININATVSSPVCKHVEATLNTLIFAEHLETLSVNIHSSIHVQDNGNEQMGRVAREFYLCAQHWLHAVGQRKGDKKAALGILDVQQVRLRAQGYDAATFAANTVRFLQCLEDFLN